ncbi:hypothetical protein P4198_25090 [Pseudomonas aeruginosa]|nr:hypothetical protein [Pseudomonas aeruginosa]
MSSTQHQLIEQCATRLRGIVEALDNIHHTSPQRWLTDLDDVHSSAESLLAMIKDQAPTQAAQDLALRTIAEYPCPEQDNMTAANMRQVAADAITGALAFGAQASQPPAEDHWLRPFYDIGRAEGQRTQDLAMLVRMLASSLKRHAPDSNLVARATNYLAAKGLAGTPLRDAPASVEQAGGDRWDALQSIMEWTAAENIPDDRKLCLIRNAARAAWRTRRPVRHPRRANGPKAAASGKQVAARPGASLRTDQQRTARCSVTTAADAWSSSKATTRKMTVSRARNAWNTAAMANALATARWVTEMKQSQFRAELVKIMPGYNWTVHASRSSEKLLVATGIQSSGSNRLSTLRVERRDDYAGSGKPRYEVSSAGYGTRSPWLHTAQDKTLARALRSLQEHYEGNARKYSIHASDLQRGRIATPPTPGASTDE